MGEERGRLLQVQMIGTRVAAAVEREARSLEADAHATPLGGGRAGDSREHGGSGMVSECCRCTANTADSVAAAAAEAEVWASNDRQWTASVQVVLCGDVWLGVIRMQVVGGDVLQSSCSCPRFFASAVDKAALCSALLATGWKRCWQTLVTSALHACTVGVQ